MKINYYKSYIDSILWSIWSNIWRHFWIKKWWKDIDICQNGNLSCAYFVSNILKQFNLIDSGSVSTKTTIDKIIAKWRNAIDANTLPEDIPIWSILTWEWGFGDDGFHDHIWFYIWNKLAVSNDSYQWDRSGLGFEEPQYCPIIHDFTYNQVRKITNIYRYDRENKIDWLFHEELNVKIYGQTWSELEEHWLSNEEIDWSLGISDKLKYWRLCWLACVLSAINYYNKQNNPNFIEKKYSDLADYRNQKYNGKNKITWESELKDIYMKDIWRSHDWLIHIAKQFGINGNIYTNNMSDMTSSQIISMIYHNIQQNKITILSIDKNIWISNFEGKKGWHLVVILWIDFGGNEYSLMIWNPISPKFSQRININRFMEWFWWKWIVLHN